MVIWYVVSILLFCTTALLAAYGQVFLAVLAFMCFATSLIIGNGKDPRYK